MSWIQLLEQKDMFTEVEWHVVCYIKDHLEYIALMNIGELAKETYSSNATIMRVCRKLECHGFRELKHKIIKEIESKKYIKQSVDFTTPFYSSESVSEIVGNISTLYKESIDIMNTNIDPRDLEKIVNTIYLSEKIFVYAIGDTNITAKSFINKLIKMNCFVISATDNHEEVTISSRVTNKDCVLLMSYSGESVYFNNCFPALIRSGCQIIALTANEKSKIAKISHHCIILPDKENENKIATFYSQLAFHYVLHIIYSLLHVKMKKSKKSEL